MDLGVGGPTCREAEQREGPVRKRVGRIDRERRAQRVLRASRVLPRPTIIGERQTRIDR